MNKKLLLGIGIVAVLLVVIGYVFLTKSTAPTPESTTSFEEVRETVPASVSAPVLYTQQDSTVVLARNGLSFNLPEGWTLTPENKSSEWDRVNLFLPTGDQVATIVCPAMGEGPYESATTTPTLTRSFSKNGNTYEANFLEYGYNRIETIKTERGIETRYVGPPEKTDVVKSVVHHGGAPAYETGCLLTSQGATTPLTQEIVDALKGIYSSWR